MRPSQPVQPPFRNLLVMLSSKVLLAIALVFVIAVAFAIHIYGPHLGRILHGGQ